MKNRNININLSIKTKIALSVFALMAGFILFVNFIIKDIFYEYINSSTEKNLSEFIRIEEPLIIKSVLEDDIWSIYKISKAISNLELVKNAGFIDKNNIIIAHSLTSKYKNGDRYIKNSGKDIIEIPIKSDDIYLGEFIIKIDQTPLTVIFETMSQKIFYIILFAAILSFFIALFISNRILFRLNILTYNVEKILQRKYDEVLPLNGKEIDEITLFQKSIQQMLKDLQNSFNKEVDLKEFYHFILENSDNLILICDAKFNLIYDNNNSLKNIILDDKKIKSEILKKIEDSYFKDIETVRFESFDGNDTKYLQITIKEVDQYMALFFNDITSLKILQEKKCLTNSFEIIGQLSSMVIHEIKNFIQPAKLILEDEEIIEKNDKKMVENSLNKIDRLVTNFLSSGKPIDKNLAEKVDLEPLILNNLDFLKNLIQNKKLSLDIDISSTSIAYIGKNDMEIVILNILKNAIEASYENKALVVNTYTYNNHIVFKVTNFGQTIDKKILQNIHKPFFSTKKENNHGIGLFTVYKIIYTYDGYIEVDSLENSTSFKLFIPKKARDENSDY